MPLMRRKEQVVALLLEGKTYPQIRAATGASGGTISFHAKRLGLTGGGRGRPRPKYDWGAVQTYHDAGHSVRRCAEKFGFHKSAWAAAVRRGRVIPRPHGRSVDEMLIPGEYRGRGNVKKRLLSLGLLRNECYECRCPPAWHGKPLVLVLDHVNGDKYDWRLDNLRL